MRNTMYNKAHRIHFDFIRRSYCSEFKNLNRLKMLYLSLICSFYLIIWNPCKSSSVELDQLVLLIILLINYGNSIIILVNN